MATFIDLRSYSTANLKPPVHRTFVPGFYKHQTVLVAMSFIWKCMLSSGGFFISGIHAGYSSSETSVSSIWKCKPQVAKTLEILTALSYGSGSSTAFGHLVAYTSIWKMNDALASFVF